MAGLSTKPRFGADLHAHTIASDGELTPSALIDRAVTVGLEAVAVTDHDTIAGIPEALDHRADVVVVPGIEISCDSNHGQFHLLGYFIDHRSPFLTEPLAFLRQRRRERAEEMLRRLAALGMPVTLDVRPDDHSVGRPHIAKALLEAGHVSSGQDAFARFLGPNSQVYIPSPRVAPFDAIDMILRAGGAPVLAHPHTYPDENMIRICAKHGLLGIEGRYASYSDSQVAGWTRLAKELGLIVTAGSDFHGSIRPDRPLGMVRCELSVLEELKRKRRIL